MRAILVIVIAAIQVWVSGLPVRADDWQVTQPLSKVVVADGKAPSDFVRDRLLTSTTFILNSASIPFDDDPGTNEGEDRAKWGMLAVEVHSLNLEGGCIWTAETTLYAALSGGVLMGVSVDGRAVQIWNRAAFGSEGRSRRAGRVAENTEGD